MPLLAVGEHIHRPMSAHFPNSEGGALERRAAAHTAPESRFPRERSEREALKGLPSLQVGFSSPSLPFLSLLAQGFPGQSYVKACPGQPAAFGGSSPGHDQIATERPHGTLH